MPREPQLDPTEWSIRINPSWLNDEDRRKFDEEMQNMPMKNLLKRGPFHFRQLKMDKCKERMMKDHFSMMVIALTKDSAMSGEGDQAGYMVFFYYEPKDELAVKRGLKGIGIDLMKQEVEVIDPDDCSEDDYYFMYSETEMIMLSDRCWEMIEPPEGVKPSDICTFCDK